jgi:hypothetical protein
MSFPHDFKEYVDQISFPDSMAEMKKRGTIVRTLGNG